MTERASSPIPRCRRSKKLTVVIPARDEAGCIASTVEHLHLELRLHDVPHEIIVVDDGSKDRTWEILERPGTRMPALAPVHNPGPHGFGRAIVFGLDHMTGDAVVVMMADESDDCRDVVRYWRLLNEGWECVFGSRFVAGGGTIDYPRGQAAPEPAGELRHPRAVSRAAQRHHQRVQSLSAHRGRRLPSAHRAAFQSHCRTAAQGDRARLLVDGHPDHLAQPADRRSQAEAKEMGSRYLFIILYVWLEKVFQPGRLSQAEWVIGAEHRLLELQRGV